MGGLGAVGREGVSGGLGGLGVLVTGGAAAGAVDAGVRATARRRGATVPLRRREARSPASARTKRRGPRAATSRVAAGEASGASGALVDDFDDAGAADETTGACGAPMPISTAAAPALAPGTAPPSQARKRCGAAVAKADHATVRRPR